MMMMIMIIFFVIWLTDERYLALFPAGTIVIDPHHRESLTSRKHAKPEFSICCSDDNHYTTAPPKTAEENTTAEIFVFLLVNFCLENFKNYFKHNSSYNDHCNTNIMRPIFAEIYSRKNIRADPPNTSFF